MTLKELQHQGWLKDAAALDAAARLLHMNEGADGDDHETTGVARVLMGVGAWLSGLFLCGFIGFAFADLFRVDQVGFAVIGALAIVIAVAIQRFSRHIFVEQLGLAISVAGHLSLAVGLYDVGGDSEFLPALIAFVLLCPVVYWLSGSAVQRFLSVSMVWLMVMMNSFENVSSGWFLGALLAALAAVVILFSGRFPQHWLRPAALASVMWLFVLMFFESANWGWHRGYGFDSAIYSGVAVALAMVGLLSFLSRTKDQEWIAIGVFALVLVGLAAVRAPGLAASLGLVAVAHARRDRIVEWLSLLALGGFMVQFYYFLGVTLLVKSMVLMAAGVLLMVLSWFLIKASGARSLATAGDQASEPPSDFSK